MTLDEQDIVDNIPMFDLLQNISARLFSLHEENRRLKEKKPKWHKVADGDLPKDNMPYIVKVKLNYRGAPNISYWIKDNLHAVFFTTRTRTNLIPLCATIPSFPSISP